MAELATRIAQLEIELADLEIRRTVAVNRAIVAEKECARLTARINEWDLFGGDLRDRDEALVDAIAFDFQRDAADAAADISADDLGALLRVIQGLHKRNARLETELDTLRGAVSSYLIVTGPCEHSESDPPRLCDDPTCNYCALERSLPPSSEVRE